MISLKIGMEAMMILGEVQDVDLLLLDVVLDGRTGAVEVCVTVS